MISYYELLGMIEDKNEPDLVKLRLSCGTRYYQAFYDDGEFNYYGICNEDEENDDFKYYLADSLLESQMFEKNIDIIEEPKKIEKLSYQQIGTYQLDNNDTLGFVKDINKQITQIGRKINEIIDVINKQD